MGKLSRQLKRAIEQCSTSETDGVVSFQVLADNDIACIGGGTTVIASTPKKALRLLLKRLRQLDRPRPHSLKALRRSLREANEQTVSAAESAIDALKRSVPTDSEPEERQTLPQKNTVALIDTLVAMVRRAGTEMPGRVLRETFELDLAALLKEHGIEAPPVARRESKT